MKIRTKRDQSIIAALKGRYFDVISKESIPNTPKLTQEADDLESAIREMESATEPEPQ